MSNDPGELNSAAQPADLPEIEEQKAETLSRKPKVRREIEAVDFERPLRPTLTRLALPVMFSNILTSLVGYVDFYMIQSLGKDAHAALSISRSGIFFVNSVFMGASIGAAAYVARTLGAGNKEKSRLYAAQAVMTAIYISFPIMLLGYAIGPRLFIWLGASGPAADYGWDYISIIFLGMSVFGMRFVTNAIFNALGQTSIPMYLNVFFNLANYFGNLLLIPIWGVMGCAMSTIITCLLAELAAVAILWGRGWAAFALSAFKGAEQAIRNMMKLGAPTIAQVVCRTGSMMLLFKIISLTPNATAGAATLGLGILCEGISFMPGLAIMVATGALVGQALGAKRLDKAAETYFEARRLTLIIMTTLGALFFVFAEQFVTFFSKDPDVIREGVLYLRINAFAQPLMAITFAGVGCLRGAGDTKYPFLMTLIANYAVRLPLAYLLAVTFNLGLLGIWLSMLASNFVETSLIVHRVNRRKWLEIILPY